MLGCTAAILSLAASYRVAYFEINPTNPVVGSSAKEVLSNNTNTVLEHVVLAAKERADMLIVGEYGLSGFLKSDSRDAWLPYCFELPRAWREADLCSAECDDVLSKIACAARRHQLAILIDILEVEYPPNASETLERKQFNTALVFDKMGRLVARWRKMNLWGESGYLDVPQNCDTSSGIFRLSSDWPLMGVFVCADFIFEYPVSAMLTAGVRHFFTPVAWSNEMPQMQVLAWSQGWASHNGATVSVVNTRRTDQSGSGVFRSGSVLSSNYTVGQPSQMGLVVVSVPFGDSAEIRSRADSTIFLDATDSIVVNSNDVPDGGWLFLSIDRESNEICSGVLCCSAQVVGEIGDYVLGVLLGRDNGGGMEWGAAVCGVWHCVGAPSKTCLNYSRPDSRGLSSISISMRSRIKLPALYPEIIFTEKGTADTQFLTTNHSFTRSSTDANLSVDMPEKLLTSAIIYGRVFSADPLAYSCPPS